MPTDGWLLGPDQTRGQFALMWMAAFWVRPTLQVMVVCYVIIRGSYFGVSMAWQLSNVSYLQRLWLFYMDYNFVGIMDTGK
jgi:hypothetical protein